MSNAVGDDPRSISRWLLQLLFVLFAGVAVFVLPAVMTVVRSKSDQVGVGELLVGRVLVVAALAVLVALTAASSGVRGLQTERYRRAVVVMSSALVAWVALAAFVLESAAAAGFSRFLPATVRRATVDLAAGSGIWVFMCLLAVVAMLGAAPARIPFPELNWLKSNSLLLVQILGAAIAVGLLAVSRYYTWLELSGNGFDETATGWALPWLGPATLAVVWIAALGFAAAIFLRVPTLMLAVGPTLLVTVYCAAAATALASAADAAPIPDRLVDIVGSEPTVMVGPGVTWSVVGAAVGLVTAVIVMATGSSAGATTLRARVGSLFDEQKAAT